MSTETSLIRQNGGRLVSSFRKKVIRALATPGVSMKSKNVIRKWVRTVPTVQVGSAIDTALIEAHTRRAIW